MHNTCNKTVVNTIGIWGQLPRGPTTTNLAPISSCCALLHVPTRRKHEFAIEIESSQGTGTPRRKSHNGRVRGESALQRQRLAS